MTYLRILSLLLVLGLAGPVGAQTSTIDATQPASGSSLASSPVRNNFGSAKTEIQELMDRDADTTQVSEIVVYSSTDAEKVGSDSCSIATAGTAALTCTAGINAGITDASAAALAATQGGAGPSIYAFGGPMQVVDGTSAGGQVQIFEGSSNGSNYVEFVSPAALSVTNTITFDSNGLIPVAEVSGAVTGPGSSTSAALPTWNGTGGTALNTQSNWTISSGVLTGSSSRISMSGASTGATPIISATQTSTGLLAKLTKGSAYFQVGTDAETTINSTSGDPGLTITQLGDGDGLNILQSGAVGDIVSMVNGTGEGMAIGNGGVTVFSATDSTFEPVTISQGGTGPMLEVLDATSGGKLEVLNGGGTAITNDSSSNQLALNVTQSHASANILSAEGFDVLADSSVTVVSTGAAGLFAATDSDDGLSGILVDNAGITTVTGNSTSTAFKSFQNSTGNVLALQTNTTGTDPSINLTQKRTTTTDGTVTTIYTLADITGLICHVTADIVASCTGGSCTAGTDGGSGRMMGTFRAPGGTAAQIGSTGDIYSEFSGAYSSSFSVTGDDVLVRVTGAAGHNLTWHAHVTYSCLAS